MKRHLWHRICDGLGQSCRTNKLPASARTTLSSHSPCISISIDEIKKDSQNGFCMEKLMNLKSDSDVHDVVHKAEDNEEFLLFYVNSLEFIRKTLLDPSLFNFRAERPKENVLIEFSSPNIAKPFHMGHLRSTIVGNFAANVLSTFNSVKKVNYLGDWGTQFGFIQAGINKLNLTIDDFEKDPMKKLYEAYVKAYNEPDMIECAREIFTRLEKEDTVEKYSWGKIQKWTVDHLVNTYKLLGVQFDEYSYESHYKASNIQHIIDELIKKGIAVYENELLITEINGAVVPLLKQDGSTLYLSRDIAAAVDRLSRHKSDRLIYVVDKSQAQHIQNLKNITARLGLGENTVEHLPFGRIIGMSTRKGTSVLLEDILDESTKRMQEQQKLSKYTRTTDHETTKLLGLSTLFIYMLKQRRTRDFSFDWDHALKGSGDTGVKLQYTHSRLKRLEERFPFYMDLEMNMNHLTEPCVLPLVVELSKFDEVLAASQSRLESYIIVIYLFKLCNLVSRCFKELPLKDEPEEIALQRSALFRRSREAISICMQLLGVQTLDEM